MTDHNALSATHIETERKFLIAFPPLDTLRSLPHVRIKSITQTYLTSDSQASRRVRSIEEDGARTFVLTEKRRISPLSCYETEYEIPEDEYLSLLALADKEKRCIEKMRYAFPYLGHTVEVDVFPFWQDRALLEIELEDEEAEYHIPSFIHIIKEVSQDSRYKNTNLARALPYDAIEP